MATHVTSQPGKLFEDSALKQLDAELWLQRRLTAHLAQIFNGDTDVQVRRERVRRAIIAGELEAVVLGKRAGGGSETYSEAFARLYGEPLHGKAKRKEHSA